MIAPLLRNPVVDLIGALVGTRAIEARKRARRLRARRRGQPVRVRESCRGVTSRCSEIVTPIERAMTRSGVRVRTFPTGRCAACGRVVSISTGGYPFPHRPGAAR